MEEEEVGKRLVVAPGFGCTYVSQSRYYRYKKKKKKERVNKRVQNPLGQCKSYREYRQWFGFFFVGI